MKNAFRILGITLSIAVIAAAGYGITHTQQIFDWVALRNYDPPAEVVKLADETTMDDATRNVFYVNHPALQDKTNFKNSCTKQEQTIVLGCYVQNTGIFLLNVDDPRLQGIIEVTAAHEVLHAMYDRLSDDERKNVDAMTARYFETLTDERIKSNVENYRKNEPGVVPNELHSILGTEVRDLSPELETYYAKYFSNRKAIVAFSEKYEKTFIDLEAQVSNYDKQLKALRESLEGNETQLESIGKTIDTERNRLDRLRSSGDVESYNSGVAGFNSLVNQYNALLDKRKSQIAQYNEIVEMYNKVATTEAELYDSLKTTPSPLQDKALN